MPRILSRARLSKKAVFLAKFFAQFFPRHITLNAQDCWFGLDTRSKWWAMPMGCFGRRRVEHWSMKCLEVKVKPVFTYV